MHKPSKLFNRDYLLLWQGQAVSKLGSQVFSIAMVFWIIDVTGSATIMGLLSMFASIPALLLGPIGGSVADRHSRKQIIVFSDVLNGIAMVVLAAIVYFFPDENFSIIGIFVISIFVAIVNSFFYPAISAAIPDLVPKDKIAGANTMTELSLQISVLIGQGLGGIFFKILGAPLIFLFNGLSFLFSAGSESFITIPQKFKKEPVPLKQKFLELKNDILEGMKYIWSKSGLRELFLVAAFMDFFITPIIILIPFYVEKFLGLGQNWNQWFGFILATYGLGNMAGYVFVTAIKFTGKTRGRMLIGFIILEAFIYSLIGWFTFLIPVMLLTFVAGFLNGFTAVNITIILQLTTPSEIRGRVFGLLGTFIGAVSPIAMGLSGVVADLVDQNIPVIYIFCGLLMATFSIMVAFSKNYRDYLSFESTKAEEEAIPALRIPPGSAGSKSSIRKK
jgi:MFS family permease